MGMPCRRKFACMVVTNSQPRATTPMAKATYAGVLTVGKSSDVLRRDAKLFGLNEPESHPLADVEPLIIAVTDRRTQGLLGHHISQDHMVVGLLQSALLRQ